MGQRNQIFDPDLLRAGLLVFGLFAAILVGAAVIQWIRRVYLSPEERDGDLVKALREALLAGTMDDAEFQRAMNVLTRSVETPTKDPAPVESDPGEQT